ncbi:hypothetical protein RSOL_409730, partial [Rhizoctonia solani AG-3 Rhs1AP]
MAFRSFRILRNSPLNFLTPRPLPALSTALEHLKEHKYQFAAHDLRELMKSDSPVLPAGSIPELELKTPFAIAHLGARISLANHTLEPAAEFAKCIEAHSDVQQMNSVTLDVVTSLLETPLTDSLSVVATILTSTPPAKISPALFDRFYQACTRRIVDNPSHLVHQVWLHCNILPHPDGIISLLKFLVLNGHFADASRLVSQLLIGHNPESEHLPAGIPMHLVSDLLAYGVRAGATEQCLQIYDQVSRIVGDLPSSGQEDLGHTDHNLLYGRPHMTLVFVRHFVKLSKRGPDQLQEWQKARVGENPRYFLDMAENVYATYAAVNGFDRLDVEVRELEPGSLRANSHTGAAIICLLELGRYAPALHMFASLFDQHLELHEQFIDDPDVLGLGVNPPTLLDRVFQSLIKLVLSPFESIHASPRLYNIIIHQLTKRKQLNEAFGLLKHSGNVERGNLSPEILDTLVQARLKNIECHWNFGSYGGREYLTPNDIESMTILRLHGYAQIFDVFQLLGKQAKVSTVHNTIKIAQSQEHLNVARTIGIWGNSVGILDWKEDSSTVEVEVEEE